MNSQIHLPLVASLASHCLMLLLVVGPPALHAQQNTSQDLQPTETASSDPSVRLMNEDDIEGGSRTPRLTTRMIIEMTTGEMHLTSAITPAEGTISRWFELETASISSRYHFLGTLGGRTATSNQYQITFKGHFNFDKGGRYNLKSGFFSGNSFTGGWNRSGWGSGTAQSNLFLKQLLFSAMPASGVEVQYGGLYFDRGQSTEVTSYDYDGYLVGERITLSRPRNLYFDEISITYGFLGDFNRPDVFGRSHRLGHSNYHEFGVTKKIGNEQIRTSASYAYEEGKEVLRQAIKIRTPVLKLIDSFLFEDYERVSPDPAYGFGVYGEKQLRPRVSAGGGFAQIDRNGLNSDRFLQGKRVYLNVHFRLIPEFVLIAGATQAVSAPPGLPRTRFDMAFEYDVLHLLRKTGLF